MSRVNCSSYNSVFDFALSVHIPEFAQKTLSEMNCRELNGLKTRQAWIMGFDIEISDSSGRMLIPGFEFNSLNEFKIRYHDICLSEKVRVVRYYCYQFSNNPLDVILLENISKVSLDQQLLEYTGESFNKSHFYNIDNETKLSPYGIIVHRKTGQQFKIPSMNLSCLLEDETNSALVG